MRRIRGHRQDIFLAFLLQEALSVAIYAVQPKQGGYPMTMTVLWKVACQEGVYLGMWQRWYKNQRVAE